LRLCGFASQKYSTTRNLQTAAELGVKSNIGNIGMDFKRTRIAQIILASAALCVGVVYVWGGPAGSKEVWVHYERESKSVFGQYPTHELCAVEMEKHNGPSGCRRIDGPYSALNSAADMVFK